MDVLLLVVDSLRAHPFVGGTVGDTPFLNSLRRRALYFSRAHATECWTLPSHASMFTGLMPSEHGAHFQSMAYRFGAITLAEFMASRGYATELVTRNFVFDGTITGINRGYARCTRVVSRRPHCDPSSWLLAASKPRFRRHLRNTGFFHSEHGRSAAFLRDFAATLQPADDRLLRYDARRLRINRHAGKRSFVFANLYDVHAPYAPRMHSLLRPWDSPRNIAENVLVPYALSRLGEHRYLKDGFSIAPAVGELLRSRYRAAVGLMDRKLEGFFAELADAGLLDDLCVVLTSDHGEGFGEHGLYLHDASVFETHLHVPLWLMVPGCSATVDALVSTRHLFETLCGLALGDCRRGLLDPCYPERHPLAYAQHFHYPHLRDAAPQFRGNQFAAVGHNGKVMRRDRRWFYFDPRSDPEELRPQRLRGAAEAFEALVSDNRDGPMATARSEFARFEEASA